MVSLWCQWMRALWSGKGRWMVLVTVLGSSFTERHEVPTDPSFWILALLSESILIQGGFLRWFQCTAKNCKKGNLISENSIHCSPFLSHLDHVPWDVVGVLFSLLLSSRVMCALLASSFFPSPVLWSNCSISPISPAPSCTFKVASALEDAKIN